MPQLEFPLNLPPNAFLRQDESPDELFYKFPRLVTHIDEGAIAAVTQLYREYLPLNGVILDLMSSWVSHLPEDVQYKSVIGLGMNIQELQKNRRLHQCIVQNLNEAVLLPLDSESLDGAVCCVSIDYLTKPVEVLREVNRALKKDAPMVITFSNRCFPMKAVLIWLYTTDEDHIELVKGYFEASGNWKNIEVLNRSPKNGDPLFAVVARRDR